MTILAGSKARLAAGLLPLLISFSVVAKVHAEPEPTDVQQFLEAVEKGRDNWKRLPNLSVQFQVTVIKAEGLTINPKASKQKAFGTADGYLLTNGAEELYYTKARDPFDWIEDKGDSAILAYPGDNYRISSTEQTVLLGANAGGVNLKRQTSPRIHGSFDPRTGLG